MSSVSQTSTFTERLCCRTSCRSRISHPLGNLELARISSAYDGIWDGREKVSGHLGQRKYNKSEVEGGMKYDLGKL